MTKSTKLQSEFVRRFNRINSGSQRYVSAPEIDSYLNEALQMFFENRVPLYKTSNLAKQELRILEEKNICFSCQQFDNRSVYFELPENYYKILRAEAFIQCPECPEISANTQEIMNHDVSEILRDPNWIPSYNYAETYYEMAGNKVIIYHNNAFEINRVCIDYLRKPKPIATPSLAYNGSYIDGNGDLISVDSDLELDVERKIADLAVLIAARDLSDFPEFQSQAEKIMQTERIYIS